MKINASSVAMASTRSYHEFTAVSTSSSLVAGARLSGQANMNLSLGRKDGKEGKDGKKSVTMSDSTRMLLSQLKTERQGTQGQNQGIGGIAQNQRAGVPETEENMQIKVLKRLMEMLRQMREGKDGRLDPSALDKFESQTKTSARTQSFNTMISFSSGVFGFANRPLISGAAAGAGVWTRETVVSSFYSETENTAFSTTGVVKTADGREINFNVQVEMSRSFMESTELYHYKTQQIMTDPLVINLDTNVADVRDQKFFFDLDADGTADEISFVKEGSGFLALDKNGDGKINDGTELFGTQSGNGFADLAAYDEDGNGWIDENDSVFDKLLIWTKDRYGNDRLIGLGKAGVGAFYLGSASTEFSRNDTVTNETKAQIRRTGVYLKESGAAGTMQHVDLAM